MAMRTAACSCCRTSRATYSESDEGHQHPHLPTGQLDVHVEPSTADDAHDGAYDDEPCSGYREDAERVVGPGLNQVALSGQPGGPGATAERVHDAEVVQRPVEIYRW